MKTIYQLAAAALILGCTACNDSLEDVGMGNTGAKTAATPPALKGSTRASTQSSTTDITGHVLTIDTTLTIGTQAASYSKNCSRPFDMDAQSARNVDVHLSVLPLYAYGDADYSGDYYAVEGYVIAHNKDLYGIHQAPSGFATLYGYFMGDLGFDLQLLDNQGQAVSTEAVAFYTNPEPSTTISSTTYTKGFTFSINAKISFGYSVTYGPYVTGSVLPSFKWNDSSTQNLPDQTVQTYTGSEDRSVHYDFITNNYSCDADGNNIPTFATTDQRVDFSFVWHVKTNHYAAKDYGKGNMKLRFNLRPQLLANALLEFVPQKGVPAKVYTAGLKAPMYPVEENFVIDLPDMDRTPVGSLSVYNPYNYWLTDITVWRSGDYGKEGAKPVEGTNDIFSADDSYDTLLREGEYDFVFNLRDGDTGDIKYEGIIRGISIEKCDQVSVSLVNKEKR